MTSAVIIRETACAKINLYLRVGARRPDGFHDVLTLMRRVSLADTLKCTFAKAENTSVHVMTEGADTSLPTGADNLAARGVLAVLQAAKATASVTVRLQKNIPTAAGLGGGSSDAAAAMRAANRFLGGRFTDAGLECMAASIGSDVPFFITGRTALCYGHGECLAPVPSAFDGGCVILAGREPSATAAAYAALDAARAGIASENAAAPSASAQNDPPSPAFDRPGYSSTAAEENGSGKAEAFFARFLPHPDFSRFSPADLYNDFEAPVSRLCPSVPLHLAALRDVGAISAAMSGSGSATFGLFPTADTAEKAAEVLRGQGFTAFSAALL